MNEILLGFLSVAGGMVLMALVIASIVKGNKAKKATNLANEKARMAQEKNNSEQFGKLIKEVEEKKITLESLGMPLEWGIPVAITIAGIEEAKSNAEAARLRNLADLELVKALLDGRTPDAEVQKSLRRKRIADTDNSSYSINKTADMVVSMMANNLLNETLDQTAQDTVPWVQDGGGSND